MLEIPQNIEDIIRLVRVTTSTNTMLEIIESLPVEGTDGQPSLPNQCDTNGTPLLHIIIATCNYKVIQAAFDNNKFDKSVVDANDNNTLHALLKKDDPRIPFCQRILDNATTLAIEAGVDCTAANADNITPVYLAAQNNHVTPLKLMMEHIIEANAQQAEACSLGISPNFSTSFLKASSLSGLTPMGVALSQRNFEILTLMLNMGFGLADHLDLSNHDIPPEALNDALLLFCEVDKEHPAFRINQLQKFMQHMSKENNAPRLYFYAGLLGHAIDLRPEKFSSYQLALRPVLVRLPASLYMLALSANFLKKTEETRDFLSHYKNEKNLTALHLYRFNTIMSSLRLGIKRDPQITAVKMRLQRLQAFHDTITNGLENKIFAEIKKWTTRTTAALKVAGAAMLGYGAHAAYKAYDGVEQYRDWLRELSILTDNRSEAVDEYEDCYIKFNYLMYTAPWFTPVSDPEYDTLEHAENVRTPICLDYYEKIIRELNIAAINCQYAPNPHPDCPTDMSDVTRLAKLLYEIEFACSRRCSQVHNTFHQAFNALNEHCEAEPDSEKKVLNDLIINAMALTASALFALTLYKKAIKPGISYFTSKSTTKAAATDSSAKVLELVGVVNQEKFGSALAQPNAELAQLLRLEQHTVDQSSKITTELISYYEALLEILKNPTDYPCIDFRVDPCNNDAFRNLGPVGIEVVIHKPGTETPAGTATETTSLLRIN